MNRYRLSPAGLLANPELAARVTTGTDELEPTATPGVVKVRWGDDTATWLRTEYLEPAD